MEIDVLDQRLHHFYLETDVWRIPRLTASQMANFQTLISLKWFKISIRKKYYHLILCEMATIHQFDNNPEEDEFYLVEIYWFITYTLVEPSINQQFIHANTTRLLWIPTFVGSQRYLVNKHQVGPAKKSTKAYKDTWPYYVARSEEYMYYFEWRRCWKANWPD